MRTIVLVVSVVFMNGFLQGQTLFESCLKHIYSENRDSAFLLIQNVKSNQFFGHTNLANSTNTPNKLESFKNLSRVEAQILTRFLLDLGTYRDYINVDFSSNYFSRKNFQNFVNYLNRRIETPKSFNRVDLDYVKLQSRIIQIQANELDINEAKDSDIVLKGYLSKIQTKDSDFEMAQLYAGTFDALLSIIENNIDGLKAGEKRMQRAIELGDTSLYLIYGVMTCNRFIYENDLSGYIEFVFGVYDIAKKSTIRDAYYYEVCDKLINGLSYAQYPDQKFIEDLIFELHKSGIYYAKSYLTWFHYFFFYLDADVKRIDPIVKKLGFRDLSDMIRYSEENVQSKLINNDFVGLLVSSARLLKKINEEDLAFDFLYDALVATRNIYSQDLAQILADSKTDKIDREKDLILAKEKEKFELLTKASVFFFVLFIFTIILAVALARRRNILKLKNIENLALIQEKDLLMMEIHHRVKNNFELVSALLELQSTELENEEAKKKLFEGQARIQSLSLLHNKLYDAKDNSTWVNMQEYFEELAHLMLKSAELSKRVKLEVKTNNINLDIDTTTPMGLIINELITNSCKYAFRGEGSWGMKIELSKNEDYYIFDYTEEGIAEKWDYMHETKKGLGMLLINNLVKQLGGKMEVSFSNGAKFRIWFKDKVKRKKID